MTIPLPAWRRAGRPQVLPLPPVADVHALALALDAPALFESGGSDRERFHVVPILRRGCIVSRDLRTSLSWQGSDDLVVEGTRALDVLRDVLRALAVPAGEPDAAPLPGLAVVLSHDLVHEIERLPVTTADRDGWPWLIALACPAAVVVEAATGQAQLVTLPDEGGPGLPWGVSSQERQALARRIGDALAARAPETEGGPGGEVVSMTSQAEHERAVLAVKERLLAGDVYQANVSLRFETPWRGSALPLHGVLRNAGPAPFSGWLRCGDRELVCGSPERLVSVRGGELRTEPIAGTWPLSGPAATPAEVAAATASLLSSPKDRCEHVMIVDIHRNDLARACEPGTLRVHELMRIDRRSHLVQAVADVRARLRAGADVVDVVEAILPGGCVTGVPKVSAMRVLDEVERFRRGPYTGAFGMLSAWGDADLAVVIRSAWRSGDRLAFHAGSGIVLGSRPEAEHAECLAKARALVLAVEALAASRPSRRAPERDSVGVTA